MFYHHLMFSKHQQGKPIGSQVRQVVNNVRVYFAKTKEDKIKKGDEKARYTNVIPRPAGVFSRTRPAGGGADSAPPA